MLMERTTSTKEPLALMNASVVLLASSASKTLEPW